MNLGTSTLQRMKERKKTRISQRTKLCLWCLISLLSVAFQNSVVEQIRFSKPFYLLNLSYILFRYIIFRSLQIIYLSFFYFGGKGQLLDIRKLQKGPRPILFLSRVWAITGGGYSTLKVFRSNWKANLANDWWTPSNRVGEIGSIPGWGSPVLVVDYSSFVVTEKR